MHILCCTFGFYFYIMKYFIFILHIFYHIITPLEAFCNECMMFYISHYLGWGVFATAFIQKGTTLFEYTGLLTDIDPGGLDTYVYEFLFKGKHMWLVEL